MPPILLTVKVPHTYEPVIPSVLIVTYQRNDSNQTARTVMPLQGDARPGDNLELSIEPHEGNGWSEPSVLEVRVVPCFSNRYLSAERPLLIVRCPPCRDGETLDAVIQNRFEECDVSATTLSTPTPQSASRLAMHLPRRGAPRRSQPQGPKAHRGSLCTFARRSARRPPPVGLPLCCLSREQEPPLLRDTGARVDYLGPDTPRVSYLPGWAAR